MYCGSTTKVERRIRTLEPVIPQEPPPEMPRDPTKAYEEWGTARLVAGIMRCDEPVDERVAMAGALDGWFHVNDEMASYVFALVEFMAGAPRDLDMALSGILGKMICSDTLSYRQVIIAAGEHYCFRKPWSAGLVDALSLGDGATVGLLMDSAQWGAEPGAGTARGLHGNTAVPFSLYPSTHPGMDRPLPQVPLRRGIYRSLCPGAQAH